MTTWFWLGIAAHVMLCIILVLLVLIQNDKGGGLAGAFGGMGSGAAFSGAGAATFITKLTRWVAFAFMALVLALTFMAKQHNAAGPVSDLKRAVQSTGLGSVLPQGLGDLQNSPVPLPPVE